MRWNIACLVGFLVLLPACGGGGGGGGSGGGSGTVAITEENAAAVAGLVLGGSEISTEVFETLAGFLDDVEIADSGTENCPGGGTITVTSIDRPPAGEISAGDSGTITFKECVLSVGGAEQLDGSISYVVTQAGSAIVLEFQIDELTITGGSDSSTIDGDISVEIRDSGGSEIRSIIRSGVLAVKSDGETRSLENYINDQTVNITSGDYTAETSGTLRDSRLGGTVVFETTEPLKGSGTGNPDSGQLLIKGSDGSAVRLTVLNNEDIRVEVDADGDGEFETEFTTTFDALGV